MTARAASPDVGEQVEELIERIGRLGGEPAEAMAGELVRVIMEFYAAGLASIVGSLDRDTVLRMAADPLVDSQLVLHELHPLSVDERIEAALDGVRPYLGSHAGGVAYLGIDDSGVAHLRLDGSCNGCGSSTVTVKLTIEEAVMAAAPELVGIDVEGQADKPKPLLQIGTHPAGAVKAEASARWQHPRATDLPTGELTTRADIGGHHVLLARLGEKLYAYEDVCAVCAASLAGSELDGDIVTCRECGARFDLRLAGRSTDSSGHHLTPIPLLDDVSGVRLALDDSLLHAAGV